MVKNLPANAGDTGNVGLIPGLGRSSEEGNSNPLLYSCLKNPMDRGVWQATVHRVARVGHDLECRHLVLEASLVTQKVKNLPAVWETGFNPWVGKIPWRREWQPTPVFLSGESNGQRSLVGCSSWVSKESDTSE